MKKILFTSFFLSFFLLSSSYLLAQLPPSGKHDLRFTLHSQTGNFIYVDLEIKAHSIPDTFRMASANFRMSFTRAVRNPLIDTTYNFNGLVSVSPLIAYSPHNLNGTIDTIISYNLIFQTGFSHQATMVDTTWIPVGRLSFEIDNPRLPFILKFHPQAVFPATTLTGYVDSDGALDGNGLLYSVNEGNYTNLTIGIRQLNPPNLVQIGTFPNVSAPPTTGPVEPSRRMKGNAIGIYSPYEQQGEVIIRNMLGDIVYRKRSVLKPGYNPVENQPLKAGTYILENYAENGRVTKKFTIR